MRHDLDRIRDPVHRDGIDSRLEVALEGDRLVVWLGEFPAWNTEGADGGDCKHNFVPVSLLFDLVQLVARITDHPLDVHLQRRWIELDLVHRDLVDVDEYDFRRDRLIGACGRSRSRAHTCTACHDHSAQEPDLPQCAAHSRAICRSTDRLNPALPTSRRGQRFPSEAADGPTGGGAIEPEPQRS